jgi:nitroreductase
MTDFFTVLKARKSVRSYLPKPVEKEKLAKIAESAYESPCAGEISISIVTNPALLAEINDKALIGMKASGNDLLLSHAAIPGYKPLYGAPALLVFSAPASNPFSAANAAAAGSTAAFAATALGLGSVYAITPTLAINGDPSLAKRVGLADGISSFVGLLVGYQGPEATAPSGGLKPLGIHYVE